MISEKKLRRWLDTIVDGLLFYRHYEIKNLTYSVEQRVLEGCKLPTYFVQFAAELDEPVGLEMIVYPNACFDFNDAVYSERFLARLTAQNIPDIVRATGALIWANRLKALLPNNQLPSAKADGLPIPATGWASGLVDFSPLPKPFGSDSIVSLARRRMLKAAFKSACEVKPQCGQ